MGRWGIRGLKTRVEQKRSISRGSSDCTVKVYVSEEGITVLQVGTRQGGSSKSKSFQEL